MGHHKVIWELFNYPLAFSFCKGRKHFHTYHSSFWLSWTYLQLWYTFHMLLLPLNFLYGKKKTRKRKGIGRRQIFLMLWNNQVWKGRLNLIPWHKRFTLHNCESLVVDYTMNALPCTMKAWRQQRKIGIFTNVVQTPLSEEGYNEEGSFNKELGINEDSEIIWGNSLQMN